MRTCTLERIEEELDTKAYKRAKAEFDADPTTYSSNDVMESLGFYDPIAREI